MNKKIFNSMMWKLGERVSAQLVTFIVSLILARLLSPKEYGSIAMVMIFITIANVFVTSGLGSALIQKKNINNVDYSSVFYFNIIFSIFIYLIIYFCSPYIARYFNMFELCDVFRILGLRIPLAAINSIQQAYVSRNMLFKKFFYSTLFGTLISGIIGVYFAYKGFGIWSLVAQYLVNSFVDTCILWFTVKWRPSFSFSMKCLKELLGYGWKILVSSLLDTVYTQLRSLVIGKKYSSDDLAYYNRGQQFPQLIVVNINTTISSVLFPAISKHQDDLSIVKNMTRRAIKVSSYLIWPMMIGLCVIAKPLINLMLGSAWDLSVIFVQIWALSYALWPIHTANLEAIKAIGRSDIYLKLEIIKKVLGVMLLLISMKYGVNAIAFSMVLTSIISGFINAFPNKKTLNYGVIDQLKDLIPSFMISLLMGILICPFVFIIKNNIALILIQTIFGILFYAFLSKIFKLEAFDYIKQLIFKRKG